MIDEFRGQYRFLSNFWYTQEGWTVEHRFQAEKTLDPVWKKRIMEAETPGKAKRLGGQAPIRPGWEKMKRTVMYMLVQEKFFNDSVLKKKLINTGNKRLIEGNTWHDNFWGDCRCNKCNIPGQNWLGKILTQVRDELRGWR